VLHRSHRAFDPGRNAVDSGTGRMTTALGRIRRFDIGDRFLIPDVLALPALQRDLLQRFIDW